MFEEGQEIGRYKVHSCIGEGGMGVVYLAEDTVLHRKVALKILPISASTHQGRLGRFEREARAASALNHPNIITIHEFGQENAIYFLATELVEGKTLREEMKNGALPWIEVLRLAEQIALGLSAAHEVGIVHRDVKPENIMVRHDRIVKILDFGLAKLTENLVPSLDRDVGGYLKTEPGTILGTVSYMSPEQARGESLNSQTDIWSLGVVLYEMLTGCMPFTGPTQTDILVAVLIKEPAPLSTYLSDPPAQLQHIIDRSLSKSRKNRYSAVSDMLHDIQELLDSSRGFRLVKSTAPTLIHETKSTKTHAKGRLAAVGVSFLIIGALFIGFYYLQSRGSKRPTPLLRQHLVSTFDGSHSSASFSPDGGSIAFINDLGGVQQIWIKNFSTGSLTQVASVDEAPWSPRWSPDSGEIAYAATSKGVTSIYSVSLANGQTRKIIEGGRNPSWSWDGTQLVFERNYDVWTANRDGSDQRRVEAVPPTDLLLADRRPSFSPDGSLIAFFQNDKGPVGDYWVVPASGGPARRLTFDNNLGGEPVWMPDGESIVFPSQRAGSMTLWTVPVAGGEPEPVLTSPGEDTEPSISRDGNKIIYTNTRNSFVLALTDPATGETIRLRERRVDMVDPSFSPDGGKIVFFGTNDDGDFHIFTIDKDGKNVQQITQGGGERNIHPHFTADGITIYFYQIHPTVSFRKVSATGGQSTEVVAGWQWGTHNGARVSPDGKRIVYSKMDKGEVVATMIRDIESGSETAFSRPLEHPRWSHDGRFILGADSPGRVRNLAEVTLCSVAVDSCESVAKGYFPQWSHDDSAIYYRIRNPKGVEEIWTILIGDATRKRVMENHPIHPIGGFFDISPQGEIVWIQYHRGKHELWMAERSN